MTLDHVAYQLFESLFDTLEETLPIGWEIDLDGRVLTFTKDHTSFLLNFHEPTQEIWLSSPVSGAHHFIYKNAAWLCARSGALILDVLRADIDTLKDQ